MLNKTRINAKKKRAQVQPAPSAHLAQMLFRLGEFGAIGFLVLAAIKFSQKPVHAGIARDVFVFSVIGLASFLTGWTIRWLLSGNSDLS